MDKYILLLYKDCKGFISTAEASQVIINKAFLGSFSGVGSKMVGKVRL